MTLVRSLLLLLLFLFPFGQLTKIPFPLSPSISIYANDLCVMLLVIFSFIYFIRNKNMVVIPPLTKYLFLFIGFAGISNLINIYRYPLNEIAIGSLYLLRWSFYAVLYPITYNLVLLNKSNAKIIIRWMLFAGVTAALFGLIQYFLYPNLRNLMYLGWDPHEYRIFGTFFDSGFTGLFFLTTLLLLSWSIMHRSKDNQIPAFFHNNSLYHYSIPAAWILVYIALVLTYSRSSYVSLIVAFSVATLLYKTVKPLILSLLLVVPLFFILPQPSPTAEATNLRRTTSIEARISNYETSRNIINEYPLFGIGFNMLRYEQRNRNIIPSDDWENHHAAAGLDNSLLFILATTGIVGLLTYSLMYIKIALSLIQNLANTKLRHFSILVITTISAIMIHSMFNNSLVYPWVMIWVWILLGVSHQSSDNL